MISALTYVPTRNPLSRAGALVAATYLGSFVVVAFAFSNPLVLVADGMAVIVIGLAAGVPRALRFAAWISALLAALMIATNAIASQRGDTVLVRGPDLPVLGTIDISLEALAEGGVLALRVAVVIAAFAVFTAAVDPDRVMRLLRPLARRSALTATLVVRMVPLAAADYARLAEAAALRGPAAAPVGRAALLRRLVAGSLDRAIDVAATLELRGFTGSAAPGRASRPPRPPVDRLFWVASAVVLAAAATTALAGLAEYESYPLIALDSGAATIALAALLPLGARLPFGVPK